MRKSGYRSIFHIYLVFFILLVSMIAIGAGMLIYTITVQKPNGQTVLSNWCKNFTEEFSGQIIFEDDELRVKQNGLEKLQSNNLWLQVVDADGAVIFSYNTPREAAKHYSPAQILNLYKTGDSSDAAVFTGYIQNKGSDYVYIIGFPVKISKIMMYLNADRFTGGKFFFLEIIGAIFFMIIILGILYGYWITKHMSSMTDAIKKVAKRTYSPIINHDLFEDVYDSLNALDKEIRAADDTKARNDKMREEWIANITHDLKTPLTPIKGYAELICESDSGKMKDYGAIILRNTAYAEDLIDDLKLTYQLENEMLPLRKSNGNIVRFVKELIIDILNHPDYTERSISFYSREENITFCFDPVLLKRAFDNLLINALVHNSKETEIGISIKAADMIQICIADNGKGIAKEELQNLFTRYYRGTNKGEKPEGTGLGLAIARQIIRLHGGEIEVESKPGKGTIFTIVFSPELKVN